MRDVKMATLQIKITKIALLLKLAEKTATTKYQERYISNGEQRDPSSQVKSC